MGPTKSKMQKRKKKEGKKKPTTDQSQRVSTSLYGHHQVPGCFCPSSLVLSSVPHFLLLHCSSRHFVLIPGQEEDKPEVNEDKSLFPRSSPGSCCFSFTCQGSNTLRPSVLSLWQHFADSWKTPDSVTRRKNINTEANKSIYNSCV